MATKLKLWSWWANMLTWSNMLTGSNMLWTWSNMLSWNVNQNSWIWFSYKPTTTNNYKLPDATYNPKYPWFDKQDYEILERMADKSWLKWQAKQDLMDDLYMQYYDQVINKHKLDERQQVIKEQAYSTKDDQWDTKAQNQTQIKLAELSQKAKKKFGIDASINDETVINTMVEWIPNWWKLLEDYINNWDKTLLYEAWLISWWWKVAQMWKNFMWWIWDSVTWLWQFAWNVTADAVWWVAKKLWADENKVNDLVQEYKDYAQAMKPSATMWADTNTPLYNVTKGAADVIQVIWWEWIAKWAIQSTAKWAKVLNTLKNAPTWQKMVAWWLEWAWDMALYSIVSEGKLPSVEETWIWAAIGSALPWWAAVYKASKPYLKSLAKNNAAKLELSGLLNPAKLNAIKNQLVNEWTDLAQAWLKWWTAEDVWTWMIDRWFKWDKTTIINELWNHAKKSHNLKREVLWASDTVHTVESANKSLNAIYQTIKDVPWLEKKLSRVEALMWKQQHTLAELDEIKSILDDTIDIYTNAWDVRAWAVKDWLDLVRKDLKKYIENEATKEWLWNVKLLNNETQIAKSLQDAISRKDSADAAREMLWVFSKTAIGWAAWYNVWPFDTDTLGWKIWNIIVWALAWKYLFSTKSKTQLASLLNKISWGSKKELERLVAWDLAVKDLSKTTKDKLVNIFNKVWPNWARTPKEFEQQEFEALLKKYSYWDIPALEFKEWVNDAWKNILVWWDKKIIATPSWANLREGQITDVPLKRNTLNESVDDMKIILSPK